MDATFLGWSRLGFDRSRLLLARLRRGVQHALDHRISAARRLFIAVLVGRSLFSHG
jgi:hypothetical protein